MFNFSRTLALQRSSASASLLFPTSSSSSSSTTTPSLPFSVLLASSSRFCSTANNETTTTTEETTTTSTNNTETKSNAPSETGLFPRRRIRGLIKDNCAGLTFAQCIVELKRQYRGTGSFTSNSPSSGNANINSPNYQIRNAFADAVGVMEKSVPAVSDKEKFAAWLTEENASMFLNGVRFFGLVPSSSSSSSNSSPAAGAARSAIDENGKELSQERLAEIASLEKGLVQIQQQKEAIEKWVEDNVCEFKDPYYRVAGALSLLQSTHSASHIQEKFEEKLIPSVLKDLRSVTIPIFEQSLRLLHWCELDTGADSYYHHDDDAASPIDKKTLEKNKKTWQEVAAIVRERENEIGNKVSSMIQCFTTLVHYVPDHEVVKDLCDTICGGLAHIESLELSSFAVGVELYGRASVGQIKELIGRYSSQIRANTAEDLKRGFPAIARIAFSQQQSKTLTPSEMSEIRDLMQVVLDESESHILAFMDSKFKPAFTNKYPEDVARIVFAYESFGRPSIALLRCYARYVENCFATPSVSKMTPHCVALTLGILSRTGCLTETLASLCAQFINTELLNGDSSNNNNKYFFNLEEAGYCALGLSGFLSTSALCKNTVLALQKHILSNWTEALSNGTRLTSTGKKVPMIGRSHNARQNAALTTAISLCRVYPTSLGNDKNFVTAIKPLLTAMMNNNISSEVKTLQIVQIWGALVASTNGNLSSPLLTPSNPVYTLLLNELKKRLVATPAGSFGAVELRMLCASSIRIPALTRELQHCINSFISPSTSSSPSSSSSSSSGESWCATTVDFVKYSSKLDKSGLAPQAVKTAKQLAVTGAQFIHFYELLSEVFPGNAEVEEFGRRGAAQLLRVDKYSGYQYIELARVKRQLRPTGTDFTESMLKFVIPAGVGKMPFPDVANCLSLVHALKIELPALESGDEDAKALRFAVVKLMSRAIYLLSTNTAAAAHSSNFTQRELLRDLIKSGEALVFGANAGTAAMQEILELYVRGTEKILTAAVNVSGVTESDLRGSVLVGKVGSNAEYGKALKEALIKNEKNPNHQMEEKLAVALEQMKIYKEKKITEGAATSSKSQAVAAEGKSTAKKADASTTNVAKTTKEQAKPVDAQAEAPASSTKAAAKNTSKKPAAPAPTSSSKKAAPVSNNKTNPSKSSKPAAAVATPVKGKTSPPPTASKKPAPAAAKKKGKK